MVDQKITDERLQQEIDEKIYTLEELRGSQVLLNAINEAQSHFITDSEECILFDGLLKNLLSLTKSEYGFIGEFLYNPTGEPYLKTKAITNIAWNDDTREFYKKNAPDGMEFTNTKTLFGQVMMTGKPVISNDPSKDGRRSGLPPGHPPLIYFLGLPFYHKKKLVGMAGIANRPGGYKEDLVEYLQPLLTTCANIIEAYRNENQRKKADDKMERSEEKYRDLFQNANDAICILDSEMKYKDVNKKTVEMLGYTREELLKMSVHDLIPSEQIPISEIEFNKLRLKGMYEKFVGKARTKDGRLIDVEVSSSLIIEGDKVIGSRDIIRDITERKRAEDALRESEKKHRYLITKMAGAFAFHKIITNEKNIPVDYEFIEVNDVFEQMTGLKRDQIIGKKVTEVLPGIEKDPTDWIGKYGNVALTGKDMKFESFSSDLRKWYSVSAYSPVGGYFAVIFDDITERKKAEKELLESRKNLQEAQRLAHIGSWQWTLATDTVKWSDELYNISGYDPNSSAPSFKDLSSCYTPESWKRLSTVVERALQSGESYEIDLEMIRLDGTIILTSARGEVDYDASGKIVGLHGTVQDITDRKRAEDMIKESETRLQSILDNSSTVVFLKDIQGRYITVNRRYEELFHVKRNEVVNKTDYDIFPREFADKFRMHDEQALEKLSAIEMEEVVPHDEGIHTYISVKFPLWSQDGKPYAVCGIATDITERKKAQEQIEKALKEKEVLLREVYHRVKNNMQIITSLLNLQSRYARDGEDREMFRESHNRIKSMSLVHEKLYQSKDLTTIDFKEYIKDIAKGLFQSYGANKGKIALVMDINNIALDINNAIPCGLIINELLTNSLKHAFPEGKEGEIKIAVHSMNENTIDLVVGDNGIGISEDVDFRTTKSLGLQLVTMLAENQLHGEIILDRSKGTEFTITFREVK